MIEALPEHEAHLWWIRPADVPEAVHTLAWSWQTPEERARQERYLFERSREIHRVTRALVRSVLARYTGIAPADLVFSANEWGRPTLVAPHEISAPRFNLSNTDGMVVLLVAACREVGVDVECLARRATIEIADRFFAPSEVHCLHAMPAGHQSRRFFDYWTLKESYIKARGMGLAIPLQRFAFRLCDGQPVTVDIDPSLGDHGPSWQFEQRLLGDTHLVAAAIRRDEGREAVLRLRHATHLTGSIFPVQERVP